MRWSGRALAAPGPGRIRPGRATVCDRSPPGFQVETGCLRGDASCAAGAVPSRDGHLNTSACTVVRNPVEVDMDRTNAFAPISAARLRIWFNAPRRSSPTSNPLPSAASTTPRKRQSICDAYAPDGNSRTSPPSSVSGVAHATTVPVAPRSPPALLACSSFSKPPWGELPELYYR